MTTGGLVVAHGQHPAVLPVVQDVAVHDEVGLENAEVPVEPPRHQDAQVGQLQLGIDDIDIP